MVVLSEKLVLAKSRAKDLTGVKNLNCWGADLSEIQILEKIPNVEVINFSANSIENLTSFASCNHLRELYLRRNKLQSVDEVEHLKELKNLKLLWLSGNPFCEKISDENYRLSVLKILPNLHKLDDKTVTEDELVKALELTMAEDGGDVEQDTGKHEICNDQHDEDQHDQDYAVEKSENKTNSQSTVEKGPSDEENLTTELEKKIGDSGTGKESHEEDISLPAASPQHLDNSEEETKSDDFSKSPEHENMKARSPSPDVNQCQNNEDPGISSSTADEHPSKSIPAPDEEPTSSQVTSYKHDRGDHNPDEVQTYDSAVQMSLDETNQLRVQLGLKPLSVAKYETSLSPPKKTAVKKQRKIKESTRNNLLSATLSLVAELDVESLLIVQDAIQERLNYSLDDDQVETEEAQEREKKSFEKKIVDMLEPG